MGGIMGHAIDLAWQHPSYSTVANLGYKTVIRYVSHDPTKDLTTDELESIRANGLNVALVYETFERRPLSGYSGGVNDTEEMINRLRELGMPPMSPCYYAVDFAPTPDEMSTVLEYARAWNAYRNVIRVGVYGNAHVLSDISSHSYVDYLWQTSGNSYGVTLAGINLYQHEYDVQIAGAQVDISDIFTVDHGQIVWPQQEDDSMVPIPFGPLKFGFPPNGDYSYPIPPVYSGALPWGDAWLSVCADTQDVPYRFRVASRDLVSAWDILTGIQSDESGLTTLKSGDLWEIMLPRGTRMVSLWGPWLLDGSKAPFSLFGSIEYRQR